MQGFLCVVLCTVLGFLFYYVVSPHFGVDTNMSYTVIFINLLSARVRIILNTTEVFVPGIDKVSRVWHNFWDLWVIGAPQIWTFFFISLLF